MLHISSEYKCEEIFDYLLKNVSDVSLYSCNGNEQSCLHLACMKECENIVVNILSTLLLSSSSSSYLDFINKQDIYGNSCLKYAVDNGNLLIILLLLEFNINTELKNKEEKAAIDYANDTVKMFINTYQKRISESNTIKYIIQNSEVNEMNGLY